MLWVLIRIVPSVPTDTITNLNYSSFNIALISDKYLLNEHQHNLFYVSPYQLFFSVILDSKRLEIPFW